ncbi:DUF3616 domain-containing protein [Geodermatophilus tzadiensis]|uniref:DUF3616 domain-containing protein n=1 Tax=Geodermatophilus tzadiensis TaxID=1137988 RepID=UPI001FEB06FA|nr:DUF3616 domain-containing protein [Geodermatophilus tzadiensis]
MTTRTATPTRTVTLRFGSAARRSATHTNLSAVRSDGPVLWVAGDETATIERLVADDPAAPTRYGDQTSSSLADLVPLPGGTGPGVEEEADIEGLARAGDALWAVGSHSLRRRRIRDEHDGERALRRLARVTGQPRRQVLVRIPVVDVDGLPTLVADDGTHRAAVFGTRGKDLRDLLADDEHLAPFLPIPGKDNGLDVEGIAVSGDRVYLGLRGPVLRGWAVVLELRPEVDAHDPTRLRLRRFPDGCRYRKHVLRMAGLGVRDLCPQGEDLLVLAGPTMDLDGPVHVYRWHGACAVEEPTVVRGDLLTRELVLPYGDGDDHAEGIGLLGPPADGRLLVVYDSPAPGRLTADGGVLADVVELPRTPVSRSAPAVPPLPRPAPDRASRRPGAAAAPSSRR